MRVCACASVIIRACVDKVGYHILSASSGCMYDYHIAVSFRHVRVYEEIPPLEFRLCFFFFFFFSAISGGFDGEAAISDATLEAN